MHLFFVLFPHVFVFNRHFLFTCENTSLFSVLHLAANHGREQLVNQVLQLTEQVHSTGVPVSIIDLQNYFGYVSVLHRLVLKSVIIMGSERF